MIYADQRWIGHHGIGRFARHVLDGLDYRPIPLTSHPAAALDALVLARSLRGLGQGDVFFSPGYNTPLLCHVPFAFTIHDLSHIYCPENSSLSIRLYYATLMRRACRRAAKILTVSEFTRKQIVDWAGVPEQKVVNVGCGVDSNYRPGQESYGMPFQYLLCVGNRKPHKNEFRLVQAFAKARIDPGMHLVFTGSATPELLEQIASCQVTARVTFLGLVQESKLPALYREAEAMIWPSLYEGFGLPVLESMACGTPVVTSNVTAMPEVAGDAALLVDPSSVEQMASAVERVLSDTILRQQLQERGLARARQFSWATTTAKVREILKAL